MGSRFKDHENLIWAVVHRWLYNHAGDPDDIYQICAVAWVKAEPFYDSSKGAFSTFITHCMMREVIKEFKPHQRNTPKGNRVELTENIEAKEETNMAEVQEDIEKRMACLNDREKQIIHQRFWEDKTLEEIAKPIGLSKERVRQILEECFLKMRNYAK
jgi:RNA polymerase sigma factor (sigma-70 family)